MKKNKKILFSLLALVALLTSCTQDEALTTQAPKMPDNPTNYFITEAKAIGIAMDAVNNLKPESTRSTSLNVSSVELITKGTRTANDSILSGFYAINFEEGGFALVANDERATDIYAMSGEGQFDANANNGVRMFMDLAGDYIEQEISNFSVASTLPLTPMPGPDDPRMWAIVDYRGVPCHGVVTKSQTEPFYLLETNWGQGVPYNQECPIIDGNSTYAGCVAIAIGQIMTYHQQPQSFNGHQYYWESMPNVAEGYLTPGTEAYSVAYLIHDIGLSVNMNYGTNSSGAYSEDCPISFTIFGYSHDGLQAHNVSSVISSLRNNRPVFMGGNDVNNQGGHAWVCDGFYSKTERCEYYKASDLSYYGYEINTDYYLHYNWGWNGSGNGSGAACDSNGFYFENVFRNAYANYSQDVMTICNIRYGS